MIGTAIPANKVTAHFLNALFIALSPVRFSNTRAPANGTAAGPAAGCKRVLLSIPHAKSSARPSFCAEARGVVQGPLMPGVMSESGSLPIVTVYSGDPVEAKLVASLARPGGNVTGMYLLALDLAGKQLALLKEAVPSLSRVAILVNPQHPGDDAEFRASQHAAQRLGLTLQYADVRTVTEVNNTLDVLGRDRVPAILAFPNILIYRQRKAIAEFAVKQRIPTMSGWRDFAIDGNLMTYGPDVREAWRYVATYVDKILKGSTPADLPIQEPTKLELVINLRTAKAIGLELSPMLLARADDVLE
jgi:putative ABC transport system substrate-binding protein